MKFCDTCEICDSWHDTKLCSFHLPSLECHRYFRYFHIFSGRFLRTSPDTAFAPELSGAEGTDVYTPDFSEQRTWRYPCRCPSLCISAHILAALLGNMKFDSKLKNCWELLGVGITKRITGLAQSFASPELAFDSQWVSSSLVLLKALAR